jgi:ABC-type amino acid transport substrate-binding protein
MRARLLLVAVLLAAGCGDGGTLQSADPTTTRSDTTAPQDDTAVTAPGDDTTSTVPSIVEESPTAARIDAAGTVRVGTYVGERLPLADAASEEGFEIELAREVIDRLLPGTALELVPLTAAERIDAVVDGSVDLLVRGTAHTTFRAERVAFTSPYLLDGIAVVARAGTAARLPDLEGRSVGVLAGTTLEAGIRDELAAAGVAADIRLLEDPRADFVAGMVDAYATGWLQAAEHSFDEPGLFVIWVAPLDPIAMVVSRDDPAFRNALDDVLRSIAADGTWASLASSWLPGPLPWTINEMLAFGPTR